jgi:hypothetical protein
MHSSDDRLLLKLTLGSASLVTLLRFFHAIDPNHDAGIQLQAAYNLLSGHGLAMYEQVTSDLADGKSLVTLTYFPAGYSLSAALLLGLGFSVGTSVKLLAAAATLLGWWGWNTLARPFLGEGMARGSHWKAAGIVVAIATPLFFTPLWDGTDIFLWAIVPWVIVLTVNASRDGTSHGWRLDWLAGALCGIAVLMRYLSLFLVVYVALLILWQSRRGPVLLRRWMAFGVGVLPAVMLQAYINYVLSTSEATPGGVFAGEQQSVFSRLWLGVRFLHTTNTYWTFWIPGVIARRLLPGGTTAWQLAVTAVAFVSLLTAFATFRMDQKGGAPDSRMAALGLFLAVPLTLLGLMTVSSTLFVAQPRYYMPIVPLSVFVAYAIASRVRGPSEGVGVRMLQKVCALYLVAYLATSLVYAACVFLPFRIAESPRSRVIGGELLPWPSMAVTSEFSSARKFVMARLKDQPDALLLTSRTGQFIWDPAVDRSRLYDLNCEYLQPASIYTTGPARILIHSFDDGEAHELWYFGVNGRHEPARCFDRFTRVQLLQRFPHEGLKVLEARVAEGQRVVLKP